MFKSSLAISAAGVLRQVKRPARDGALRGPRNYRIAKRREKRRAMSATAAQEQTSVSVADL
jgi:hypothetical protein